MTKQVKICVSFESIEELERAKSQVPSGITVSDYIRKKAFRLLHRNKKAGAPLKNKNNPHGRKGKQREGI